MPQSTILSSSLQIRKAQGEFEQAFIQGGQPFSRHSILVPSGNQLRTVHWHKTTGIWGSFNEKPPAGRKHFWNLFGLQNPADHRRLRIACQINPSHHGPAGNASCIFAQDESGEIAILHKGMLGGAARGLTLDFFWDNTDYEATDLGGRRFVQITTLGSARLVDDVARFAAECARIKVLNASLRN